MDDHSTNSASPPSPTSSTKDRSKAEPKRPACVGCRTIKVRCILPPNEPTSTVCTRCIRLHQPCEYPPPAPKGRRPRHSVSRHIETNGSRSKDHYDAASEGQPPTSQYGSITSSSSAYASSIPASANPWANKTPAYVLSSSSAPIAGPSGTAPSLMPSTRAPNNARNPASSSSIPYVGPANHPSVSSTGSGAGTAGSPRVSEGSRRQLLGGENVMDHSLRSLVQAAEVTMAENAINAEADGAKGHPTPGYIDPVDLHILGLVEAEQLFQIFHTKLNPFIKILDPHLHTMEWTRRHSSILFSAVLCVAGKFSRADLYPQLLAHAQQLVGRALADTICHIGVVQSLGILVYWKEPTDASAWMKVGIAIRMGYQLRLNAKRTEPLPSDDVEARLVLDRERTWLNLVCFDKSYHLYDESEGRRVGLMIPDEKRDLDRWLQDGYPYGVEDDSLLALSVETGRITELRRNVESSKSLGAAHALAAHLTAWLRGVHHKWTDATSSHYRCSRPEGAQKMRMMNTWTNTVLIQSLLIATEFKDEAVLAEYFARAGEFIDESLSLARSGVIEVVQDSVAVALFTAAEFLYRLFPMVNLTNQTTIVRWLTQVYTACKQVSDGRDSCVSAYIARFYRQVLRMISASSSIPATRPVSPAPAPKGTLGSGNHATSEFHSSATPNGSGMNGGGAVQLVEQNPFAGLGTMGDELFNDFAANTGLTLFDGQTQFDDSEYWNSLGMGANTQDWSWFGTPATN